MRKIFLLHGGAGKRNGALSTVFTLQFTSLQTGDNTGTLLQEVGVIVSRDRVLCSLRV